jgi:flavin reductase (DIM6/NTAB) family NADH-FMN oxidoreductase RutF
VLELPEDDLDLKTDSRWPAFFPAAVSWATVGEGRGAAVERIVGAAIVNRFPYVLAISVCRQDISARHYDRQCFRDLLERTGTVAVQLLPPGRELDRLANAVAGHSDRDAHKRIGASGLGVREAESSATPVFEDAYLVYEGRLAEPTVDADGTRLCAEPWLDCGSHRIYFFEVTTIQLRADIARGDTQIRWRSLPSYRPGESGARPIGSVPNPSGAYKKPYTPHYAFPAPNTVAFESRRERDGMVIADIPRTLPADVTLDNDESRWPCFFPSSLGMITSSDGVQENLMPCGSTTVVSRRPLVVAPCVSYAGINERYAPRASLELIRQSGRFGCGVPFIDPRVLEAIRYAGNTTLSADAAKLKATGLRVVSQDGPPLLPELPIQFDCEVIGEMRLGTHMMLLGEARRIRVREDVTPDNPVEWYPLPTLSPRTEHST